MLHTKYKFGQYNNFLYTEYIKQGPLNRDNLWKKKEHSYKISVKKDKCVLDIKIILNICYYSTVICASVGRARGGGLGGGGGWDDWIIWSQGLLCVYVPAVVLWLPTDPNQIYSHLSYKWERRHDFFLIGVRLPSGNVYMISKIAISILALGANIADFSASLLIVWKAGVIPC